MILEPAGTFDALQQQIGWWPTATEATYGEIYAAVESILRLRLGHRRRSASCPRGGETVTPVDLSSVDDPATGYLVTGDGQSEGLVTMTNGQAGESIVAAATRRCRLRTS